MADREELERRASRAYQQAMTEPMVPHVWRNVLDALGLTEETAWADDGNNEAWDHVLVRGDALYVLGGGMEPATDSQLREIGLVKKRRYVTAWEVLDD